MKKTQYLLLQARKKNDPMIEHEKSCFRRALECGKEELIAIDIIRENIKTHDLKKHPIIIIGGSGDFSIAKGGPWMKKVLEIMNYLYEASKITFASCWGFQAMAKARGGTVINNVKKAELGTTELWLTQDGKNDNVFKKLPSTFLAQMGHEDIVTTLPENAILLASSKKVKHEAFTFKNKPIYCTQFHPELNKNDLQKRMETYPSYIDKILGVSQNEFMNKYCLESNDTNKLILHFISEYMRD